MSLLHNSYSYSLQMLLLIPYLPQLSFSQFSTLMSNQRLFGKLHATAERRVDKEDFFWLSSLILVSLKGRKNGKASREVRKTAGIVLLLQLPKLGAKNHSQQHPKSVSSEKTLKPLVLVCSNQHSYLQVKDQQLSLKKGSQLLQLLTGNIQREVFFLAMAEQAPGMHHNIIHKHLLLHTYSLAKNTVKHREHLFMLMIFI